MNLYSYSELKLIHWWCIVKYIFIFIIGVWSIVPLKSWAKTFLMEYEGELKSLLQLFNCIYILFKTPVKTATLLDLKTR